MSQCHQVHPLAVVTCPGNCFTGDFNPFRQRIFCRVQTLNQGLGDLNSGNIVIKKPSHPGAANQQDTGYHRHLQGLHSEHEAFQCLAIKHRLRLKKTSTAINFFRHFLEHQFKGLSRRVHCCAREKLRHTIKRLTGHICSCHKPGSHVQQLHGIKVKNRP